VPAQGWDPPDREHEQENEEQRDRLAENRTDERGYRTLPGRLLRDMMRCNITDIGSRDSRS
jgi:hypothetical protein